MSAIWKAELASLRRLVDNVEKEAAQAAEAQEAIRQRTTQRLKAMHETGERCREQILAFLSRRKKLGACSGDIAAATGITQDMATHHLARMMERGEVVRNGKRGKSWIWWPATRKGVHGQA